VIVKGVHSSGSQQVAWVRDAESFRGELLRIAGLRRDGRLPLPIVQEYVPGHGYGVTALAREGEVLALFMHRRILEYDVARGVRFAHGAAGARSVDEPELRRAAVTLLRRLRWDGMVMLEFRRDARDGRFLLLEINPRFVGSLELAIASGMDFPWHYLELASKREVTAPPSYRVGLEYYWLLSKNVAAAFENPRGYGRAVVSALRPGTRCDLSLRDPAPHWFQLRKAAWWVSQYVRARAGELSNSAAKARAAGLSHLG
jgi:predicted ATP-grasp superfamily ATP-dependent carboligase